MYPVAFGPRIDLERNIPFLPDDPFKLMIEKRFNQVPMIVGLNSDEGGLFSARKSEKFDLFKVFIHYSFI